LSFFFSQTHGSYESIVNSSTDIVTFSVVGAKSVAFYKEHLIFHNLEKKKRKYFTILRKFAILTDLVIKVLYLRHNVAG